MPKTRFFLLSLIMVTLPGIALCDDVSAGDEVIAGENIAADEQVVAGDEVTATSDNADADFRQTVRAAVAEIRSGSFTQRERASTELFSMGLDVVPMLRSIVREQPDREVDVRLNHLIGKLTEANLDSQLRRLMEGEDVDIEGWRWFRLTMGPSAQSRQLFGDLIRTYPDATAALSGSPRDRGEACDRFRRQSAKIDSNEPFCRHPLTA